ncbi:MAG: CheB methylesterase domain-containing protein [Candidatus Peregrinibacteria bacterium]
MHTPSQKRQTAGNDAFPVVVIGASTGGPPIIEQIVMALPRGTRACVLIAQHMPAQFTAEMSKRLAKDVCLPLKEAQDGDRLNSGTIFIAPGNRCMEVRRDNAGEPMITIVDASHTSHEATPSIDELMRSVAKIFGKRVTGFLLTGMGRDGTIGMQFIQKLEGHTYAQTPSTCVVDSMVEYAIGCDTVEKIIRPEHIAGIISSLS